MNTLSRLDSYVASLAAGPSHSPSNSNPPTLQMTPPTPSAPNAPSSFSPSSSIIPASLVAPPSTPPRLRRNPSSPSSGTRRRRRGARRPPTSSSIKLPSPATPLLLRVALAIWSMLLTFWSSLVGDTRAVRSAKHKRRGIRSALADGEVTPASASAGADTVPTARLEGLALAPSSDEGSGSDMEPSDREWIDPVTRAPDAALEASPSDDEFAPRAPADSTFSFRLRSAQNKDTVTLTGSYDSPAASDDAGSVAVRAPSSILAPPPLPRQASNRLLPNPMATSLLDPSVPAVPHRSVTPSLIAPPRIHQTPFHLQKTLILDLDETLIHSTSRPIGSSHAGAGMLGLGSGLFGGRRKRRGEGHTVEVVLNGRSTTYHVYKRPYVDFFLKKVASWYTLVIFTASMPEYADPVIDWLDNGRGLFAKRLYRESCFLQPNGSYVKDLADVEKDLSRVCFMDNSPISYQWNKANALPIEGWTSDPYDEALLQSIPVLDSLRFVTDVRRILGIRGFA